MSPLEQAEAWLEAEQPSTEEIQVSIDNLCHQLAKPPRGVTGEQLHAAIALLMKVIGKEPGDLVLPETHSQAELDYGPLGGDCPAQAAPQSPEERRALFERLREDLSSPF